MRIEPIDTAAGFAAAAAGLLDADPANNNPLLSALHTAVSAAEPASDPWASVLVRDASDTLCAAARLFRQNWVLSTGLPDAFEALGRWATARHEAGMRFAGFRGPLASAAGFEAGVALPCTTFMALPLFQLNGEPRLPRAVAGQLRQADERDLAIVSAWSDAFRIEARLQKTGAQAAEDVARQVRAGARWLWVDEAGAPAGLIGAARSGPSAARIGPVYTPPPLRGRGIGGAMVATLAQDLRRSGIEHVFLFTDLANPVSNALYPRIGFVPAGQHVHRAVLR